MRYNTYINNQKCLEWGLNACQGALFDLLNQLSSWAEDYVHEGKIFYNISRHKILEELPLFYTKDDTVYRHLKILQQKGLIEYVKDKNKNLVRLTEKGKAWNVFYNSDLNPKKLGFESEKQKNSDLNPTNNIINPESNKLLSAPFAKKTSPKPKKEITEEVKRRFDDWWKVYPLKKSKLAALKKFAEVLQGGLVTFAELMEGARKYDDEVYYKKTEKRYIKHPTTWLNQGCWADEYEKHEFFHVEGI